MVLVKARCEKWDTGHPADGDVAASFGRHFLSGFLSRPVLAAFALLYPMYRNFVSPSAASLRSLAL